MGYISSAGENPQLDIVKVIGQVVKLKQEDDGLYSGECPFCGGQFVVHQLGQHWKCYKCSPVWGAVYSFVKKWVDRDKGLQTA